MASFTYRRTKLKHYKTSLLKSLSNKMEIRKSPDPNDSIRLATPKQSKFGCNAVVKEKF